MSGLREALRELCGRKERIPVYELRALLIRFPDDPSPVASRERVAEVLATHTIECTGLGEVTCRACRDRSWMSWSEYRDHVADALLAAGVFRDEATVKAEVAEQIAAVAEEYADELEPPTTSEWLELRDWFKGQLHEVAAKAYEIGGK